MSQQLYHFTVVAPPRGHPVANDPPPRHTGTPPPLCRPEHEVEISLAIKGGPNVVQVYGFCFDAPDGKPRIVLELCAHGSLRKHLKALPRDKVCTGL